MLRDKKRTPTVFEYPLIIREEMQSICINIPDLSVGIAITHPYSFSLSPLEKKEYYLKIGKAVVQAWMKGSSAIEEMKKTGKTKTPSGSARTLAQLKTSLLSPKEVAKLGGISYKTVQRAIDSGKIKCIRTAGGHRRVPLNIAENWIKSFVQKITSN